MKLAFEQLKSAACGAVKIEPAGDGASFGRFSEKEELFYETSPVRASSKASAGVRLSFRTDSEYIDLSVSISPATSRRYFLFDIFCDGVRAGVFGNIDENTRLFTDDGALYRQGELPLGESEGRITLPAGEHLIDIYLPWSVKADRLAVSLSNGASFEPVKREKKMLIYGDSITQGYDMRYPANAYSHIICNALCAEGFNKAVGGERLPAALLHPVGFTPDLITVAAGTNYWYEGTKEELERDATDFFTTLLRFYPGVPVYIITPFWREDTNIDCHFENFESLSKIIASACPKEFTLVRGLDLLPHDQDLFGDRRIHPNDRGDAIIAENLLKIIKG